MTAGNRLRGVGLGLAALCAAMTALVIPTAVEQAPPVEAQATGIGAGGEFHPMGPTRIFDSRPPGINDPSPGKKAMNATGGFTVRVAGRHGLPPAGSILAIVANVTVVEPEGPGWLGVRPTGGTPGSALVTFPAGRNVPNVGIVGVGSDGNITVNMGPTQSARAHVVIDLFGWISTSSHATRGARLVPTTSPARLVDTRQSGGPIGQGQTRDVQIRGAVSYSPTLNPAVPNNANVTAALVNIAAINTRASSTNTFISASPNRLALPVTTANLNVVRGQVKTNLAIVPIGSDGRIRLYNHAGQVDVVVDVFGYFQLNGNTSTAGRVVPLSSPFRAFDTRQPAFGNVPLGAGTIEDWSFRNFAQSVTLPSAGGTVLTAQGALLGNIAGTDLRRTLPTVPVGTYLTGFPGDRGRPLTSNLNVAEGEVVSNMALLSYGTKTADPYVLQMYNHAGSMHYVLDVYAVVLD